jgi:osmotically-inducible protein OsmY
MPSNNRFENERGQDRDRSRDEDYSRRQGGYPSSQMSQYDDGGSRSQGSWSTGEDYQSRGQMGGSSETGYGDYGSSRFRDRDDDSSRYRQGRFDQSHSGMDEGRRYPSGPQYGESRHGSSRDYGPSYRTEDYAMGASPYIAAPGGFGAFPSGASGDYRRSRDRWSQNDYDGRDVSRPYGTRHSRDNSQDDFGSWREFGEKRGFFDRASDEVASWFGDEDAARRRELDHRGRGPSNYTRSDDRIQEDVNEQLTRDWHIDATHISVTVSNGEVTLDGYVPTRDAKRRAEDCAEDISGVKHVQNNLRIHHVESRGSDGWSARSGSGGRASHNLTSTSTSDGTGNATTGVGTTAPGATGSTGASTKA